MKRHLPLRCQRGFGLFDGVVSLALLAFGMLALTRFETRLGGVANESAQRMNAAALSDELLSAMLTDNANAACYTLPAAAGCGSPAARALTEAWRVRAMAKLPNASEPTSTLNLATGRLTVTLSWYYKEDTPETRRTHQVQSDVRP